MSVELTELAAEYAEAMTVVAGDCLRLRRAFMAGAAAALDLAKQPGGVDQLRAQVIAYGRTIGTPAETA